MRLSDFVYPITLELQRSLRESVRESVRRGTEGEAVKCRREAASHRQTGEREPSALLHAVVQSWGEGLQTTKL